MPNYSSVLIVFCQIFTWIALGDVDLCCTLTWVTKADAVDYITKVINQYTSLMP